MFAVHDLNAFVAVVETGSVRAAAERMHRTQSAVSQALKRLELAAGFTLMDRSAYRIGLTDEGRQFAKRARALLREAESLRRFADGLAAGTEQRVRIAVHGALPASLWAEPITAAARAYPDTAFEIEAGEVDTPLSALLSGAADLALLIQPPSSPRLSVLEHRRVGQIRFARVVRPDQADNVAVQPQIIVSDFREGLESFGVVEGRRYCRVGSHAAKAELILAGLGAGSVPLALVERAIAEGVLVPIGDSTSSVPTTHDVYLYRSPDRPRGPASSALWGRFPALDPIL